MENGDKSQIYHVTTPDIALAMWVFTILAIFL